MLNSCASGIAVVNIDNGYGAGHMAALINQRIVQSETVALEATKRVEPETVKLEG
jgi:hypothetical protein